MCTKLKEPRMKLRVGEETDKSREEPREVQRGPVGQDSCRGQGAKLCLEGHGVGVDIED